MPNYKSLAAKRLAIDPNALLMCMEYEGYVIVTTPDGEPHKFTFAELNKPAAKKTEPGSPRSAIPVAEKAQKGPGSASAEARPATSEATKVAEPQLHKPIKVVRTKGKGAVS